MTAALPETALATRERAAGLIRAGRYAAAEAALADVLVVAPDDRISMSLLGMARFRSGDLDGAERAYRALALAHPGDADGQYALAVTLVRLGRADEAVLAFQAALLIRPNHADAARHLDELRRGRAGSEPAADARDTSGAESLAQLLDRRSALPLDDTTLAGELRWAARPFPVAVLPAVLLGALLIAVPAVLRPLTEALPAGALRTVSAAIWHVAAAVAWPAAALFVVIGIAAWLTTEYLIREHRLEVTAGVLVRRHIILWFHDIERQPVVQQNLAEQLAGLGSVRIVTDALLISRSSRRSRLGELVVRGLSARRAHALAALIRQATLVERRRMIANFISTR